MSLLRNTREAMRRDQVFRFLQPPPDFALPIDTHQGPILYVEDVSVRFDGFLALNKLNRGSTVTSPLMPTAAKP
jgi:hypothetical protein